MKTEIQCGWYRGYYDCNFRPGILMYPGAFLFRKLLPGMLESERRRIMEFVTGVKKKETLELSEPK